MADPTPNSLTLDLTEQAGLPVRLEVGSGRLSFGAGIGTESRSTRHRAHMLDVLAEPEGAGPDRLYDMYRNVGPDAHRAEAARHRLRYDLTVLHPGTVGREFIKTKGHYHPTKPGTSVTYPEVYEVHHGGALYVLQTLPGQNEGPRQVILVRARPGEKVVIPPGFGHITINPGPDPLVMSNWVAADFQSLYGPMEKTRGGAVYIFARDEGAEGEDPAEPDRVAGVGALHVAENPKSPPASPPLLVEARRLPTLDLDRDRPMFGQLLDNPRRLRFLTHPEEWDQGFQEIIAAWEQEGSPHALSR